VSSGAPDEVRFHLSRESKRRIYSATITSVIFVLTVGQGHAGFLFIVAILPLAVWLGWSAFVIVRRPYARLAQFICILIWAIAISLVTRPTTCATK
jgi:dolichyl-phosphate-mannose--protein O-mannosyl transferase